MIVKHRNILLIVLVFFLFVFRVLFGLCSEFWFEDELQIYLIGLKSFTTHTWPFFGPDVVYSHTQIPGALQGLLVSIPLYIVPVAEAPTIFLNILAAFSLSFFAWFITKRFPLLPQWLVWIWVFTCPWIMNFSTRVINPSYAVVLSIPFFVCFFDVINTVNPLFNKRYALLGMGVFTTMVMQLHLSWILLPPFGVWALWQILKMDRQKLIGSTIFYMLGLLIGAATLVPTFLHHTTQSGDVSHNIVFTLSNYKNLFVILTHFLSFAAFEIPYMLGCDADERLAVIKQNIWMAPFALFLLVLGWLQVIFFAGVFFVKSRTADFSSTRIVIWCSWLLVYAAFFFSIAGPGSHTFFIFWPLSMFYSFYAYQWLFNKNVLWLKLFKIAVICGLFFHVGLALYNLNHRSLYLNRPLVQKAIDCKDFKILGTRRGSSY